MSLLDKIRGIRRNVLPERVRIDDDAYVRFTTEDTQSQLTAPEGWATYTHPRSLPEMHFVNGTVDECVELGDSWTDIPSAFRTADGDKVVEYRARKNYGDKTIVSETDPRYAQWAVAAQICAHWNKSDYSGGLNGGDELGPLTINPGEEVDAKTFIGKYRRTEPTISDIIKGKIKEAQKKGQPVYVRSRSMITWF